MVEVDVRTEAIIIRCTDCFYSQEYPISRSLHGASDPFTPSDEAISDAVEACLEEFEVEHQQSLEDAADAGLCQS